MNWIHSARPPPVWMVFLRAPSYHGIKVRLTLEHAEALLGMCSMCGHVSMKGRRMVAWHTNKAHLCASQHGKSMGGLGGFVDEGVVNIYLWLTFATERSTHVVRFIFSRGQRN